VKTGERLVEVGVGYALGRAGRGIAYARTRGGLIPETIRVPFAVPPDTGWPEKERLADYAALRAVARALRRRGMRCVRLLLNDERLANEVTRGSEIDKHLALSYVRLRCELNAFSKCEIGVGSTEDLTHRARAEAALNLAA